MRIVLVAVGRLKVGPERELFDRYLKRLTDSARTIGLTGVELREVPESRARRAQDRVNEEAAGILGAISQDSLLVLLDERGPAISSLDWAAEIGRARDSGRGAYAVAIGGADGLGPELHGRADRLVSFGAVTWPHQLVRAMAAEQLYRAATILSGHPYHRA
jgi:23S rRNA (pseudouridine1915-N3)-methyltransferase